jgi:hypothetical protein
MSWGGDVGMKPGTRALERHIEQLEQKIADLKPKAAAKPSPETGMAMLRKAKAKNELTKAKNKRAKDTPTE